MSRVSALPRLLRRFRDDKSGVALLEFAFSLPIVLTLSLTGAELTNYIITKMRVSQIALHLADNAARIGSGTQLQAKTISEADINDLLTGADLQSGELKLLANGRVTISSIEPDPSNSGKSRIRWQRCQGDKTSLGSTYGAQGDKNLAGVGPSTRQVAAPDNGVTMFVEVRFQYTPLIKTSLSPTSELNEIASMMVRDRRDTTDDSSLGNAATHPRGIYKVSGVSPSMCSAGQAYLET
ncbi:MULTISPECIES: TadE/TadG family type IV pilus assembly protein [unclassified Sphingomonas]|uniref:TadE/TadG family type IV pilus assembly protein n=1 Tax=unclassified Sphingomonas TaxID=196159 RepID=UPI0022B3881D|nr:TadE/TadG family type IV pilus assembly protein [Sphingomonas sp. NIBR02145]WHU03832.1 pilus assembly protein [Sphingomonas sp. NIBR02145]